MPKPTTILGGRSTGAPADWDADKHGPCETLQVHYTEANGLPVMITAHEVTVGEAAALANGGHLFLQIVGRAHPPVAMWVQDKENRTIDAYEAAEFEPGETLEHAFAAAVAELDRQAEGTGRAPDCGEVDAAGQVWVSGTINLKAIIEAALERAQILQPIIQKDASEMAHLTVMTLEQVAETEKAGRQLREILQPGREAERAAGDDRPRKPYTTPKLEQIADDDPRAIALREQMGLEPGTHPTARRPIDPSFDVGRDDESPDK